MGSVDIALDYQYGYSYSRYSECFDTQKSAYDLVTMSGGGGGRTSSLSKLHSLVILLQSSQ